MVEVGGFEPPSLVLDQVDSLTPPVSCLLRGIAWRHRYAVSFECYENT
jgi:hypothetical protein